MPAAKVPDKKEDSKGNINKNLPDSAKSAQQTAIKKKKVNTSESYELDGLFKFTTIGSNLRP